MVAEEGEKINMKIKIKIVETAGSAMLFFRVSRRNLPMTSLESNKVKLRLSNILQFQYSLQGAGHQDTGRPLGVNPVQF